MGIAAAIGAIGSIGGSIIQSNAAGNAADDAKQASAANNATTLGIYNSNKTNAQSYINNGTAASNQQAALLGLGGDQAAASNAFTKYLGSTGYNFQLGEGMKAVNNNYATSGALDSGAALKSINNYAQGQASNAFQTYFGNLGGLSTTGMSASNGLAGVGTNVSAQIASNNNNAASAAGNAAISQGNAFSNGLGSAINSLNSSSYGGGGSGAGGWGNGSTSNFAVQPGMSSSSGSGWA